VAARQQQQQQQQKGLQKEQKKGRVEVVQKHQEVSFDEEDDDLEDVRDDDDEDDDNDDDDDDDGEDDDGLDEDGRSGFTDPLAAVCLWIQSSLLLSEGDEEEDDEMDDGEEEEEEEEPEEKPKKKSKKIVRPLSKEELREFQEANDRTGMIYLSRIPPYMKPQKVRHIFTNYGEVDRIYLAPEGMPDHILPLFCLLFKSQHY